MSEYIVKVERFPHGNGHFGFRFRPVIRYDENRFEQVTKTDGGYSLVQVWGIWEESEEGRFLAQNDYLSVQDIDRVVETGIDDKGAARQTIEWSELSKRMKKLDQDRFGRMIVCGQIPGEKTFQEYIWENDWSGEYPIFKKNIYLTDKKTIFGPFSYRTGKLNTEQTVSAFDAAGFDFSCLVPMHSFAGDKSETIDVFPIANLPEKSEEADCITDTELLSVVTKALKGVKVNPRTSRFEVVNEAIRNAGISRDRAERFKVLAKSDDLFIKTVNDLIIGNFKNFSDGFKRDVAKVIIDKPENFNNLYNVLKQSKGFKTSFEKIAKEVIKEAQGEGRVSVSEQEIKQKEKSLNEANETITGLKSQVAELTRKSQDLETRLSNALMADLRRQQLTQKKGELAVDVEKLQAEVDQKEAEKQAFELRVGELDQDLIKVKGALVSALPEYYEKIVFDPVLSAKLLEAAGYGKKPQSGAEAVSEEPGEKPAVKQEEPVRILTKASLGQNVKSYDPDRLIDFIQEKLSGDGRRNVSRNDVANLLVCTSQGFLTVLAGEPGTGKTSLVNDLANLLGLSFHNRFAEVAVEKGWTSKRDLIGYFNPLTGKFDSADRRLYGALRELDAESRAGVGDFPYWVLLDEANLSQMEHYWADFMGLCDLDRASRTVSLGGESMPLDIPKTLRFLATINLDHTTEILSPRLIDRAWIIMLDSEDDAAGLGKSAGSGIQPSESIVPFDVFETFNSVNYVHTNNISTAVRDRYDEIRRKFHDAHRVNFSPRIRKMIQEYCAAAFRVMDLRGSQYAAFDYAVAQKILPIINGYGDKYREFLTDLMRVCNEREMPVSYKLIEGIVARGDTNMQYYQFFSR